MNNSLVDWRETMIGDKRYGVGVSSKDEKELDRRRRTQLGTVINGKSVLLTGLHKRHYTGRCELCGKVDKRKQALHYHHWLDEYPSIGVWLCRTCHMFAEIIDKKQAFVDKYNKIKDGLLSECPMLAPNNQSSTKESVSKHAKAFDIA